jgi:hypothetical protein
MRRMRIDEVTQIEGSECAMSKKKIRINYKDLPKDFWDKVIYYEYFWSHSGFVDVEPHMIVWTIDGKQYCINKNELRDGRYERVIPFFECMVDKRKVERGDMYYLDWDLCPEGWNYYYHSSSHCFITSNVYAEFATHIDDIKRSDYEKTLSKSAEKMIAREIFWKESLKQVYKNVLGVTIQEKERIYIRFDEKIHVYGEPYIGKYLDIFQLPAEMSLHLKKAVAWRIRYTSPMEYMRNLIDITIYFEKDVPMYMQHNFEKDYPDYVDEKEFMEQFMKMTGCKFNETESSYVIDRAMDGYEFYQRNEYSDIYWIRDDIYKENYSNVIEKFEKYSGNERYLEEPICVCTENKEVDINEN